MGAVTIFILLMICAFAIITIGPLAVIYKAYYDVYRSLDTYREYSNWKVSCIALKDMIECIFKKDS